MPASGSRQSEIGSTRLKGAAGNMLQAEDKSLECEGGVWDSDSRGLSPIKHVMRLALKEDNNKVGVPCPLSHPSSLVRGESPTWQAETQSFNAETGSTVEDFPSDRTERHVSRTSTRGYGFGGQTAVLRPSVQAHYRWKEKLTKTLRALRSFASRKTSRSYHSR